MLSDREVSQVPTSPVSKDITHFISFKPWFNNNYCISVGSTRF